MAQAVKFSSKIDGQVLKELRAYAKESGRSISLILRDAVSEHLQRVRVRPAFREALEQVLDEHGELLTRLSR